MVYTYPNKEIKGCYKHINREKSNILFFCFSSGEDVERKKRRKNIEFTLTNCFLINASLCSINIRHSFFIVVVVTPGIEFSFKHIFALVRSFSIYSSGFWAAKIFCMCMFEEWNKNTFGHISLIYEYIDERFYEWRIRKLIHIIYIYTTYLCVYIFIKNNMNIMIITIINMSHTLCTCFGKGMVRHTAHSTRIISSFFLLTHKHRHTLSLSLICVILMSLESCIALSSIDFLFVVFTACLKQS